MAVVGEDGAGQFLEEAAPAGVAFVALAMDVGVVPTRDRP